MSFKTYFLVLLWAFAGSFAFAQNDTIILNNGDRLVGEFKWLENGLLKIKTDYSWGYFTIDYDDVEQMTITPRCKILLDHGDERIGHIRSDEPNQVIITTQDTIVEKVPIREVVAVETLYDRFLRKFRGLIELGYNVTKANNTRQLSIGADISYIGERWIYQGKLDVLNSRQSNTEDVERTDGVLSALRLFKNQWYLTGKMKYLSNTEQALNYRITPYIAAGNLVVNTRKMYLGLSLGLNANFETFDNDTSSKESSELMFGADLNMFNFEDIRLSANILAYQGLTESGRFRADMSLNVRISLISDFYATAGLTVNYDNQSAIVENQYDYILKTGLGYKINY